MIRIFIALGLLMGSALIYGGLVNHTYQPSVTRRDLPQWPPGSVLGAQVTTPVLVAFAHPHCPCFTTTLSELNAISDRCPDLRIRVVFAIPDGAPLDWHLGRNWDGVRAAGYDMIADHGCIETRRFNATASGQLMLFRDGKCLFQGGITAGRGHSGPAAGNAALIGVLNDFKPRATPYPVFGCPLFNNGAKI